jgi:hypothetical protein
MKELSPLIKRKRGVSIMVGYVLLVVIAIGISVLVYGFLELYVPKEKPECGKDATLIVQDYSCEINPNGDGEDYLSIELVNRGLFKADAVYIRLGKPGREVKALVTDDVYFAQKSDSTLSGLSPGESYNWGGGTSPTDYSNKEKIKAITDNRGGTYTLEIEPAIVNDETGILALCPELTITQEITCQGAGVCDESTSFFPPLDCEADIQDSETCSQLEPECKWHQDNANPSAPGQCRTDSGDEPECNQILDETSCNTQTNNQCEWVPS